MKFDVVFLDVTAPGYYDRLTLENMSMGGTEASVIRVAELLAERGIKIAIVESQCDYFEPTIGQYAYFLHSNDIKDIECDHFVQIRSVQNFHLFPKAKKYVWCHDVANASTTPTYEAIVANDATVIGVSKWHEDNLRFHLKGYSNITYAYNPVPTQAYLSLDERPLKINKDLMVWMSSPHKGLNKALELLKEVQKEAPNMQLMIFNPGYLKNYLINQKGILMQGSLPAKQMWNHVKSALCLFYPCTFTETFGCVAAEANALGVPVSTYAKGALVESVSSADQLSEDGDEKSLVQKVLHWHRGHRPTVYGQDRFAEPSVAHAWSKVLNR